MTLTFRSAGQSSAFLDEVRAQRQVAIDEMERAAAACDDQAYAEATGRVRDLEELARRNDASLWLEMSLV